MAEKRWCVFCWVLRMFEAEGHGQWFDILIGQTEYINESFEQFKEKMARYIYVIRK